MNTLKTRFLLIITLGAALALSACDSGTPDGAAQNLDAGRAADASVTLGVSIWNREGPGKALIDTARTQSVAVKWWPLEDTGSAFGDCRASIGEIPLGEVLLSPESPVHTLKLVSGGYCFNAVAFDDADATGTELESIWTGGSLVAGQNTVVLNFLNGVWTFVDDQGAPAPIELGSGSTLAGFSLLPTSLYEGLVPVALDPEASFSLKPYLLDWGTDLDMNELSVFLHVAQFNGGTGAASNASAVMADSYNITKGCGSASYLNSVDCVATAGDTEVLILGMLDLMMDQYAGLPQPFPLPKGGVSPDLSKYDSSTVVDGETMTGYLVETQYGGESVTLVDVTAGRASESVAKAAQASGERVNPVTIVMYEYAVCGTDLDNSGDIDVGGWVLSADDLIVDTGGWRCYEYGYLRDSTNRGEYSWGVEQTGSDTGECQGDPTLYAPSPWICSDQNGDGKIDTGTYQLRHYVRREETLDAHFYPFIAKGSPLPSGFQFTPPR